VEGAPYEWKTYKEVIDVARDLGKAFFSQNLVSFNEYQGEKFQFLGIYSKNREEWATTQIACMMNNVTIIPFFDSLGPDALKFVINQTDLSTMFIEGGAI